MNIIIIENKIDLQENREVKKEEAEKFCQENKYEYFEVSAKEGTNITNLLYTSVASLPIFNIINNEGYSKEIIVENLLQENLDSFRYQNNNTKDTNENNEENPNERNDPNQSNFTDSNRNNDGINNNVLLNNKDKKRNFCSC